MNGLEAIELMKKGKMVIEVGTNEPFILRIENGIVWFKNSNVLDGEWVIDDCFDFTIDYEEYVENQLTGWERVDKGEDYMAIDHASISTFINYDDKYDDKLYEFANYFSTEEKAEEIRFKQMLFRKLQRFSDENGGNEIDWNDAHCKYSIKYAYDDNNLFIGWNYDVKEVGVVYFVHEEIAKQAIELFRDDLIKYFTHDWGGENE